MPPERVTLSSVDLFVSLYGPNRVLNALTTIKMANAKLGGLVLVVVTRGVHEGAVERRSKILADCLLELESQRRGTRFENYLLVRRVKNRALSMGVAPFRVTTQGFELDTLDRIL